MAGPVEKREDYRPFEGPAEEPQESYLDQVPKKLANSSYVSGIGTGACTLFCIKTATDISTLTVSSLAPPAAFGLGALFFLGFHSKYGWWPEKVQHYLKLSSSSTEGSLVDPDDFAFVLSKNPDALKRDLLEKISMDFSGIQNSMSHFTNLDRESELWKILGRYIQKLQMTLIEFQNRVGKEVTDNIAWILQEEEPKFEEDDSVMIEDVVRNLTDLKEAMKGLSETAELAGHLKTVQEQIDALPWINKQNWVRWSREQLSDS